MILPNRLQLPDTVHFFARDMDGMLFAYSLPPTKDNRCGEWDSDSGQVHIVKPQDDDFPFVKWSDEEPYIIRQIIKDDLDKRIIKPNQ